MKKFLLIIPLFCILSCNEKSDDKNSESIRVKDAHSFAEPDNALVKHLDLDIKVDLSTHLISGKASWTIENISKGTEIVFDSRQLEIQKITLDDEQETTFSLGDEHKYLGQPIKVKIKPSTQQVHIYYSTTKDAAALQWLEPQQTAGKKSQFLFTQSQAILARTWIPCQDSPGIRFTYNAKVSVPENLLALMSAENPQEKNSEGRYTFNQPKAIPSYLMALAVGDIEFKSIDGRTGVYAEPITLQKAVYEFADMGKMVNAAEKLYGPYQWGRYDVLVLPPSFPFGGMENPNLTFLTPTLIAGDRSLVSVVAHELAHSWSGNLVTNATWNDFWLNEGFTTYIERRIVEAVYGKDEAKMQELLGFNTLRSLLEEMGADNPDTKLKGNFDDRDPDDGMTEIAYEKGYSFLRTIEEAVGRDRFDAFLKEYFKAKSFKSLSTEEFVAYLNKNLIKDDQELKNKITPDEWIFQSGIPANSAPVGSDKFTAIDSLLKKWKGSADASVFSSVKLSTNESLYLLSHLDPETGINQMKTLDRVFRFTDSGNTEIQTAWYVLSIRLKYIPAYSGIEKFLTEVGRRKYLMPLYKEMVKTPEGKDWARKIYKEARPNYHSVAYGSIDPLFIN